MEEPDYDDLIEDYMEDYYEEEEPQARASTSTTAASAPPVEYMYDDDFLEEMEAATAAQTNGMNPTNSTKELPIPDHGNDESSSPISTNLQGRLLAASTTPMSSSPTRAVTTTTTTTTLSPAAQVRSEFATSRHREGSSHPDIFSFERYQPTASWRPETIHSPTTMRARTWKSKQHQQRASSEATTRINKKSHRTTNLASTPEAQVLQYLSLHHRTAGCSSLWSTTSSKKIRISRRDKGMSTTPLVGQASIPMTLGDGNRVYVLQHPPESSTPIATKNATSSLGISMTDLIRRVQAMQRKKEHDRLAALSSSIRAQRKKLEGTAGDDAGDDEEDEMEQDDDDDDKEETPTPTPTKSTPTPVDDQLWVDKHAPSTFANLLSEERTNREVLRALREWDPYVFRREPPPRPKFGNHNNKDDDNNNNNNDTHNNNTKNPRDCRPEERQRVILLAGPPGVGKTTLAHIVARHCGYRPMEVNGSDERSASALTERVIRAMETATLDMHATTTTTTTKGKRSSSHKHDWKGRPNCIIMDEIDGADAKQALQALVELIRQDMPVSPNKDDASGGKKPQQRQNNKPYLKRPIIFICNNLYAPALRPLLPYARRFQVEAPAAFRLVARLRAVLSAEGLSLWGGATLLNELVTATGGDIRSCLYTLQFAAAEVHQKQQLNLLNNHNNKQQEDISKALMSALSGNGMKDDRNDVAGTTMTVFRKPKKKGKNDRLWGTRQMSDLRTSVECVLDAVESFGEHTKILDCLYLNILNVSYIDPTFDRCAAALQWLSGADLRSVQHHYVPCAAAALHLLCRVEQKPDLTYTTRALTDAHYQQEANLGLTTKFSEGLSAHYRGSRSSDAIVKDTVPYALWMISAGEGSSALSRPASSVEILNKKEQQSFQRHIETLHSLGLTYVAAATEDYEGMEQAFSPRNQGGQMTRMVLEPPIDRLAQFSYLHRQPVNQRTPIPSAMKELLAQRATLHGIRETGKSSIKAESKVGKQEILNSKPAPPPETETTTETAKDETTSPFKPLVSPELEDGKAKRTDVSGKENKADGDRPGKRQKVAVSAKNFLGLGAKQAKEAKSVRRARNVGFVRSSSEKMSNTGSGVPFRHVIRLKYVKGFTQAVRNPCKLEDLA